MFMCKNRSSPFSISLGLINGSSLVVIKWNPAIVTCILTKSHWLIQLIALRFDDFVEYCIFHHQWQVLLFFKFSEKQQPYSAIQPL
jgi:hypothetical protein